VLEPEPVRRTRWARRALVALVAAAALVAVALAAVVLRADDSEGVATEVPPDVTRPTATTAPTPTTASTPTTAPTPTTGAPAVVAPPGTTPATQPTAATQPTTPPATHDPYDYAGLFRTATPGSVTLAPGRSATITFTRTNRSSWTMQIGAALCTSVVPPGAVCLEGSPVVQLTPGASYTNAVTVTAPPEPGTYTIRIQEVLGGATTDVALTVTG
jgi:hypothetical protein